MIWSNIRRPIANIGIRRIAINANSVMGFEEINGMEIYGLNCGFYLILYFFFVYFRQINFKLLFFMSLFQLV